MRQKMKQRELEIVVIVEYEIEDEEIRMVDIDSGDWGIMGYGDVVLDIVELIRMIEECDK